MLEWVCLILKIFSMEQIGLNYTGLNSFINFLVMPFLDKHAVHFLFSFDNRCKTCQNITRFPRYNDPLKVYIFFPGIK